MTEGLSDLVVELALYTHWPRSEILALEMDDFVSSLLAARRLAHPAP